MSPPLHLPSLPYRFSLPSYSHLPVHPFPLPSSSSPPHSHLPRSPPHFHLLTDYTVYSAAAPSGGPLLLFFLNTLDTYSLLPTDSTHNLTYHRLVEVFKYGFALRTQLGDPNCERCKDIREQVLATQATMIKYVTCYERLKPVFVNLIFVCEQLRKIGLRINTNDVIESTTTPIHAMNVTKIKIG